MKIALIVPFEKDLINVIIETPKGARNKYSYDPKTDAFRLKKTLPLGMMFPFDFGFIPQTKGGDGDPLDVLVIMEEPSYPGCVVPCRLLGVLEAEQTEKEKGTVRNDRLIAVSDSSIIYKSITKMKELNKSMVKEMEHFFVNYNRQEGRLFKPLGWGGVKTAGALIAKGIKNKKKNDEKE